VSDNTGAERTAGISSGVGALSRPASDPGLDAGVTVVEVPVGSRPALESASRSPGLNGPPTLRLALGPAPGGLIGPRGGSVTVWSVTGPFGAHRWV